MANETKCPVCGWTYETKPDGCGCLPRNCSMRPLPQYFTDPDRAIAEGYDPELVERHRRPPPPLCPECERLKVTLRDERDLASHLRKCNIVLLKERDAALAERDAWQKIAADRDRVREEAIAAEDAALATAQARGEEVARLRKLIEKCRFELGVIISQVKARGGTCGAPDRLVAEIDAALGSPR